MTAFDLVRINEYSLNLMSKFGLRLDDAKYIGMYLCYLNMCNLHRTKKEIWSFIESEFGIPKSTAKRIVKRFSREVKT